MIIINNYKTNNNNNRSSSSISSNCRNDSCDYLHNSNVYCLATMIMIIKILIFNTDQFLMITHRWGKGDLSTREMSTVTDNPNPSLQLSLAGILGGRFQTTVLLRTISLMLLKKKSDLIKHQCIKLPSTRSIDEEVFEVEKKVEREKIYFVWQSILS